MREIKQSHFEVVEQKKIDEFGVEAIAIDGRIGTGFTMRAVCTVDEIGKWLACKRGESEDGLWCKYLQADGDGCDLYNKGNVEGLQNDRA